MSKSTVAAAIAAPRNQVCMSFSDKEDRIITRKYKAYVAKCTGKILARAAWAKRVLLS